MMTKILSILRRPLPAALVAFGACLLHYWLSDPVYQAVVTLQVPQAAATDEEAEEAPQLIPADVFAMAVEAIDSERANTGKALVDVDQLIEDLTISTGEEADHLEIRYLAVDQTEATAVLDALANAFVETSRELKSAEALPLIRKLRHRAESFKNKLEDNQTQLAAIQQEISEDTTAPASKAAREAWLKAFSTQLAQAKSDRLHSEARYREAVNELQSGSAVNLVAAQLSTGPSKEIVQAVLSHADLVDELEQLRASKKQLASVYGVRHPRMLELTEKEGTLTQQIHSTEKSTGNIVRAAGHESLDVDRRSLLLNALELRLRLDQTAEDEMQEQYEIQQASLARHGELRERLQQAQQNETNLEQQQQAVTAKLKQTHARHLARASVVMPPAVAADPVSPLLSSHLIWGSLIAVLLVMLTRWAFRDLEQTLPSTPPVATDSKQAIPTASLEERRLARLAKLKPQQ